MSAGEVVGEGREEKEGNEGGSLSCSGWITAADDKDRSLLAQLILSLIGIHFKYD